MALTPGTTLGPYAVTAKIGEGGMGEVCRANFPLQSQRGKGYRSAFLIPSNPDFSSSPRERAAAPISLALLSSSASAVNCSHFFSRIAPDLGRIVPVSIGGGKSVIWSADGSELFYRDGTAVMAIDVSTEGGTVSLGTPRQLFDGNYSASVGVTGGRQYHVGQDGRFLMLKETSGGDGENPTQIVLVQNWLEELKRLVPTE